MRRVLLFLLVIYCSGSFAVGFSIGEAGDIVARVNPDGRLDKAPNNYNPYIYKVVSIAAVSNGVMVPRCTGLWVGGDMVITTDTCIDVVRIPVNEVSVNFYTPNAEFPIKFYGSIAYNANIANYWDVVSFNQLTMLPIGQSENIPVRRFERNVGRNDSIVYIRLQNSPLINDDFYSHRNYFADIDDSTTARKVFFNVIKEMVANGGLPNSIHPKLNPIFFNPNGTHLTNLVFKYHLSFYGYGCSGFSPSPLTICDRGNQPINNQEGKAFMLLTNKTDYDHMLVYSSTYTQNGKLFALILMANNNVTADIGDIGGPVYLVDNETNQVFLIGLIYSRNVVAGTGRHQGQRQLFFNVLLLNRLGEH